MHCSYTMSHKEREREREREREQKRIVDALYLTQDPNT